jgi:2-iminobutanoate/2-iminopropanoate deaminase
MKRIIKTDNAPAPIGPYSQAVMIGNMLYTSGQIAIDPSTGELVLSSIEDETKQVMEN